MLSFLTLVWAGDLENGVAALKDKRIDDAIALLGHCTTSEPQNAECWWELGWAYYVKRDWAHTQAAWQQVKTLQPDHPDLEKQLSAVTALQADASSAASLRTSSATTYPVATGTKLRVRAVGDMMLGTTFPDGNLPPDDAAGSFSKVSALLRDADVTFGNLEGPLCDGGETTKCSPDAPEGSCYAFRSPTRYGQYYKDAGFDAVSTANNHAGDFGAICREQTLSTVAALGIHASGPVGTVGEWQANGVKVGLVAFATYGITYDLNDEAAATAVIQELAARNDVVMVSFHGGAEGSKAIHVPQGAESFYGENRGDIRRFTHLAVDAGADLVLGSGPHVLRGMEVYKDRLIAYSLGNFATYGRFNLSGNQGIGAILDVSLAADGRFLGGRIFGIRQEGRGIPNPDPANAAADLVRMLTAQDFPQYGVKVAQDGTIGRP
jgi:poly-gamma-glutamate capsule biosynthesis protein CapA/YwtB (metallophosphatase superfamily)